MCGYRFKAEPDSAVKEKAILFQKIEDRDDNLSNNAFCFFPRAAQQTGFSKLIDTKLRVKPMARRTVRQDYESIKTQCVRQSTLFEDPEFPAEDASIFYSRAPPRRYEWKRPSEICSNPQFVTDGTTRFDVEQGELDNCWFVSAVASLTCEETLMKRVVDSSQSFDRSYGGLFK
ncbi:calpain-A [Elysia marginata]|uniref:Calpain-A n=1 Tax=Elysia marginata TaxID=1093978 RepID=A0AAV4EAB6_9GAST|nr:calpain-A [Elysia marginata]